MTNRFPVFHYKLLSFYHERNIDLYIYILFILQLDILKEAVHLEIQ